MSKIIITGSEGLIGKKVSNYLGKNNKVIKVDIKKNIDLCNQEQVSSFFKKNFDADYLINLHGANEHVVSKKNKINKKFEHENIEFDYFFKNNVFSFYLTNKYFIKFCKKGKGIVNFSSIYGTISPKHFLYKEPKNVFYVSSKFAVEGLTKYFATLYGHKISINSIANHGVEWKQPKSFKKKLFKHIPKKRMLKTEDLFGVLEFLCSKKNNYINGSTIVVDGGYSSF